MDVCLCSTEYRGLKKKRNRASFIFLGVYCVGGTRDLTLIINLKLQSAMRLCHCGFWRKHDPSQSYIGCLIIPICLLWPKCADAWWWKCNRTPPFPPINSCIHVPPACGLPWQEETIDCCLCLYRLRHPPVDPSSRSHLCTRQPCLLPRPAQMMQLEAWPKIWDDECWC